MESRKIRNHTLLQLVCLLSVLFLVNCDAFPSNEVYALNIFKEAIYEDPLLVLSNWNALDSNPCDWYGISCSMARDRVIKLNVSGSSLKGFIAPELSLLTSLQELILHGNYLISIIPKEIGLLKNLRVLDLGSNRLSGPIPPEIGNLDNIVKINLQSNGLTGRVPAELGNLKLLEELRLDRNKLQGFVPGNNDPKSVPKINEMYASVGKPSGICSASQLKIADFSFNFLVGSIPKCLGYLPSSSFLGNCLQDPSLQQRSTQQCGGSPLAKNQPTVNKKRGSTQEEEDKRRQHRAAAVSKPAWLLALEIVTGVMVGSIFIVGVLAATLKWKTKPSLFIPWKKSASSKNHMAIYIDSEMLKDVWKFSRQELEVACEDFSNIIGSSSDSLIYKGTMKGGPEIAVISLSIKEDQWTGYLELYFQKEVADLARLNHENTGKLLGYCRESSPFTRMLVFEYASNGTLYEHLHYGEGCQLSWTRRMKIVIGIAKGLKYLHNEIEPPFTISQLNSSAVYLTEDFLPKVVDFESCKTIVSRSEKNRASFGQEGAICVLPNSLEQRHLDIQGNIYAFGVLLLEIISGRPPYCKENGCLVDWAKDFIEVLDSMAKVVDPELKHFELDDLKVICEVVNFCIGQGGPTKIQVGPISSPVSMQELCNLLESNIDTSVSSELKATWAELALSSS